MEEGSDWVIDLGVIHRGNYVRNRREFPGGPVVGNPRFHYQGCGFSPWSGELRSYKPHGMAKKKKKKKRKRMGVDSL